jgi:hypothetical protein
VQNFEIKSVSLLYRTPVNYMKKILSERNLVVVLFITALTIFSFAQEDAKKAEKLNQNPGNASSLMASPKQTAGTIIAAGKPVTETPLLK